MKTITCLTCFYCGLIVEPDQSGFNAIEFRNKKGDLLPMVSTVGASVEKIWPCHHKCISDEEVSIKLTDDWDRGEKYSNRHALFNPLGYRDVWLKCGCILSVSKDSQDGDEYFVGMTMWCRKHMFSVQHKVLNPRVKSGNGYKKYFIPFLKDVSKECPDIRFKKLEED